MDAVLCYLKAGLVLAARARLNDFKSRFFMSGLFGEPAGCEGLLHAGGDKDTAFAMFIVAGMTLVHELKLSLAKGTRISSALPIANTTLVYAGDPNKSYTGTAGDLHKTR